MMKSFYEFYKQMQEQQAAMTGEKISPNTAGLFNQVAAELQNKLPKSKIPEATARKALANAMGEIQTIAALAGQNDNNKKPNTPTKYTPPQAGSGMVGGMKPTV